jgi:hypothetical protein
MVCTYEAANDEVVAVDVLVAFLMIYIPPSGSGLTGQLHM